MKGSLPVENRKAHLITFLILLVLFILIYFIYILNYNSLLRLSIKEKIRLTFVLLFFIPIILSGSPIKNSFIFSPIIIALSLKIFFKYYFKSGFKKILGLYTLIPIHALDIVIWIFFLTYPIYTIFKFLDKKKTEIPLFTNLFLLIFYFLFTILISQEKTYSFLFLSQITTGMGMYLGVYIFIQNKNDFKKFIFSLIFLFVMNILYGLLQLLKGGLGGEILEVIRTGPIWGARIRGVFFHSNAFAGILSLYFFFFLAMYYYLPRYRKRLLIAIFAALLMIFFTYSRTGYLSLLIGIFLFSLLVRIKKKGIKASFNEFIKITLILLILLIILGIIIKIFFPLVFLRFESIFWGGKDISIRIRQIYWTESIKKFLHYPIFGIGLGQFVTQKFSNIHEHPHNFYIALLLETGIIGFLLWCIIIYRILKDIWSKWKKTEGNFHYILTALLISWILINFQLFFTQFWFTIYATEEMKIFWMFLGFTYIILKKYENWY